MAMSAVWKEMLEGEDVPDVFQPDDAGTYWHVSRQDPPTPGSPWRVDIDIYGEPLCRCPGYVHHGHCWYTDQLKELLMTTTETEPGTALVPVEIHRPKALLPTPQELSTIREIAMIAVSGAITLPASIKSPEQAMAIMLTGRALGIDPMIAIQELYIVNGKVAPSARVMHGLVLDKEKTCSLDYPVLDDRHCIVHFVRPKRGIDATYEVTWDDIIKAKLAGKEVNAQYPRDRLAYHATKRILRLYAPDLLLNIGGGQAMTFEDEGEEVPLDEGRTVNTATGEIFDGEYTDKTAPTGEASAEADPFAGLVDDVRNTPAMQAAKRHHDAVVGPGESEELPFARPAEPEHDDAWYQNAAKLNHARIKMLLGREAYEEAADVFSVRFTPDSDPKDILEYWLKVEREHAQAAETSG